MRTMWKGAISFGLVTIPVNLYPATEKKDIKFRFLHKECHTPLQYRKICPACNREVAGDEIIRGYEIEKDKFVLVDEKDLENIPDGRSRTIDIVDFTDLTEIDPVYFDKTYFLGPGETGEKAYLLLKKVMAETGKVAVAKVIIRSKEALAAIRVYKAEVLVLETMFFPDEIRNYKEVPFSGREAKIHDNELKMARELVLNLAEPFSPDKYKDEYREALLKIIRAKAEGQDIEIPAAAPRGKVVDLLEALKASVDLAKKEQKKGRSSKAKATAAEKKLPKKQRTAGS